MNEFILSCGTTADLTKEQYEEMNVSFIPFHYRLGETWYHDNLLDFSPEEFYKQMSAGAGTETAPVTIREYSDYFSNYIKQGKDVLHISLSSGISETYYVASGAANVLRAVYPERKIFVIDSRCASLGVGLLVKRAAELRDQGKPIEEVKEEIERIRFNVNHWFFSTDLSFYVKGGRISARDGYLGRKFDICPLMTVDADGELIVKEKVRTKARAIAKAEKKMEKFAEEKKDYSGPVYISTSSNEGDAERLKELIEQSFPHVKEIMINPIGTSIGSHTGPGTTALFFWGKTRK